MILPEWDGARDPRDLARHKEEVWTDVPGSGGDYYVSNFGRYYSVAKERILRGSQSSTGYIMYPSGPRDVRKTTVAQRLVLLAFDGDPPTEEHTDARHLDGNKTNNMLTNLAWGTRSENMRDVWRAKAAGLPTSETDVQPQTNGSNLLQRASVQQGIRLFEQGKVSLQDLATLWSCSRDVARRALVGTTWSHLERDVDLIEKHLGRTGEKHHKATVSDEDLALALDLYTKEKWSGVQFAKFLGIKHITAAAILTGRSRKYLPRPEGFQYPWPNAASRWTRRGDRHGCASVLSEAKVAEIYHRIVEGDFKTIREVGDAYGISHGPLYSLMAGRTWKVVPRSPEVEAAIQRLYQRKRNV